MPTLVLFRHGKAVPKEVAGKDEDRWLTEEGRKGVEAVARLLPLKPSVVYSSPLRRAVETAEIIARLHGVEVKVVDELRPERTTLDDVKSLSPPDAAVLVGHAPSIERLLSELIGGGRVSMSAGSAAILEYERLERGGAVLRALITPKEALKAVQRPG